MEKESGVTSWGFLILLVQLSSNAFGLDMATDPVLRALGQGDSRAAYRLIMFDEEGSKIAPVFYQAAKQSISDPAFKARLGKVSQAFNARLRRELTPLTFGAYRQSAADTNLREEDRMRLIIPMVEGYPSLRPLQQDSLKAFLKGMLASRISASTKAMLMIEACHFPALGFDGKALLPLFRSADTTIRKAALQGLIRFIASNRDQGKVDLNRALYDSLKGNGSHIPDRYEVIALASIGEDFARAYLLSRCGSDAAKLTAVIRHDPYLRHAGLSYAALAFSKDTPQGISTREALRYGLKEPEWVANQIAFGTYSDPAKADELRKVMAIRTTASR